MHELTKTTMQAPIEWDGQIVITTAQLAEAYGTTMDNINKNFANNKDRFEAGKHYIYLEGEELRKFKNYPNFKGVVGKTTKQMYLWTRRGASRHCKILGTDKAWEQFDYLEENYFDRQPKLPDLSNPMKLLELHYEAIKQADKKADAALDKTDRLEKRFNQFENDLPLLPEEADSVSGAVKKRVLEILGGKSSNAYHNKSISQTTFVDAYRNLKRNFNVKSYKCIKRKQVDVALRIAMEYQPPVFLADQIAACNAQMSMF